MLTIWVSFKSINIHIYHPTYTGQNNLDDKFGTIDNTDNSGRQLHIGLMNYSSLKAVASYAIKLGIWYKSQ